MTAAPMTLAPHGDTADALVAMLDRAIARATRASLTHALGDARQFRAAIADGDPVNVALYRHFARDLCAWIEGKTA